VAPRPARTHTLWSMRLRLACALAPAAALLLAAAPSGAASATKSCSPPKYPSIGYFNRLTVSGTSCTTGGKVALAYYRCRTKSGKNLAGRCTTSVLGYRCSEVRHTIPTEIAGRVTCRRGGATVVHVYQQDLS
jgi:hypothetical protein